MSLEQVRLRPRAYLDLERERDLDSECLEARDGLADPERLSDFALAGLPRSDLDGERDSWGHTRTLKQLTVSTGRQRITQQGSFTYFLLCICKCCGERC